MDAAVRHGGSSPPAPSPSGLASCQVSHQQSPADRARKSLLAISQADAGDGLQEIAKAMAEEEEGKKEEVRQRPAAIATEKKKEEANQDDDEEYRQKLIFISYTEAPLAQEDIARPNGSHIASPVADGHGRPA